MNYKIKNNKWDAPQAGVLLLARRRRSLRRAKDYRKLMNKVFISVSLLSWILLIGGCKNMSKSEDNKNTGTQIHRDSISILKDTIQNVQEVLQEIYPDTTINKKLILVDYHSTEKFYSDYRKLSYTDITEFSHPFIVFTNKSITQYLIAYTYEGGTKNAFDCFEIGYCKEDKKLDKLKYYKTSEQDFETESKIKLGMSLVDLIKEKGDNYETQIDVDTIVIYRISDQEKTDFLRRYQMPGYFMNFTIKESKIHHILFGFDYP
jgi:hypothetical protein